MEAINMKEKNKRRGLFSSPPSKVIDESVPCINEALSRLQLCKHSSIRENNKHKNTFCQ